VSIRNYCFENQNEQQKVFDIDYFKDIPLIFRAFKAIHNIIQPSKSLHGNINIDSLLWQNVSKQVLWYTSVIDNWTSMSDSERGSKDVKDFISVLFKIMLNDNT